MRPVIFAKAISPHFKVRVGQEGQFPQWEIQIKGSASGVSTAVYLFRVVGVNGGTQRVVKRIQHLPTWLLPNVLDALALFKAHYRSARNAVSGPFGSDSVTDAYAQDWLAERVMLNFRASSLGLYLAQGSWVHPGGTEWSPIGYRAALQGQHLVTLREELFRDQLLEGETQEQVTGLVCQLVEQRRAS